MPANPTQQGDADDPLTVYEQLAAEFLAQQVEIDGDNCDWLFDQFSDAALADQFVTAGAGGLGKLDFARLVDAFGRLRSE